MLKQAWGETSLGLFFIWGLWMNFRISVHRHAIVFVFVSSLLSSALFGCEQSVAKSEDVTPLQVRVPAHGQMPAIELALDVTPPLTDKHAQALVTPLADVVYKAARKCPEALSREGAGVSVKFSVSGNKVSSATPSVGANKGEACIQAALAGQEVQTEGHTTLAVNARVQRASTRE